MRIAALAVLTALVAGPAMAEVVEKRADGFRLKHVAKVSASPAKVYEAIGQVGRWWDGEHTYSGQAENMSLALQPGGCFCETVGQGGVRHGVVLLALPARVVRIEGALGPLQEEAVSAVLTYTLTAKDGGAEVVQTYHVGGAREAAVRERADKVDQVMAAAFARLQRYAETGGPD